MKPINGTGLPIVILIGAVAVSQCNGDLATNTAPENTKTPQPITTPSPAALASDPPGTPLLTHQPASPLPDPTSTPITHTVRAGESPWSIATVYGITAEALMAANQITDPATLQVGQQLLVPAGQTLSTDSQTKLYEIKSGDTLFSLAVRYGSTVDDILAANPGLEPTELQVGQTIIIPLTAAVEPSVATPSAATPAPTNERRPNTTSLQLQMLEAINGQRQQQGLPALLLDEKLTAVAQAHAQDMVSRDYFDHVSPEGRTLRDRLSRQGLDLNWVGENIQRNTQPAEEAVPYAMGWFMDSAPHRNNILHTEFSHIGLGVVEESGWFTFVLVFAQK